MQITRVYQDPATVFSIKGAMTSGELEILDTELEKCSRGGAFKLILDLKEVPFIDSAGLEKVLDIARDLGKQSSDLRISSLNDVCKDIFKATLMENFVQVYDDNDSALKSLR